MVLVINFGVLESVEYFSLDSHDAHVNVAAKRRKFHDAHENAIQEEAIDDQR
jgi:hypothetical protein